MERIQAWPCRAGQEGRAGRAWSPGAPGVHIPHAVHPLMTPWAKPRARNPSLLGPAAPSALQGFQGTIYTNAGSPEPIGQPVPGKGSRWQKDQFLPLRGVRVWV